jgi:hypothetical protein
MTTREPSPKAKENLRKNAELRQKNSKYIKLQPSEKTVLQFDPEKMTPTVAEYNGTKTQRYQYTVTEPNSGSNQEKYLTVGKKLHKKLIHTLAKDIHYLKFKGLA